MKILITGEPHTGKSTLLKRIISDIPNKIGFVTLEIPDPNNPGMRLGFKLIDHNGREAILAHVDIKSDINVSRYGVDIGSLEEFIEPLFDYQPDQLLYIDEIGQMELYSQKFKSLVQKYVDSSNNFIGTITKNYQDNLTEKLKDDKSIVIEEINVGNRDNLFQRLKANF